MSRDLRVLVQIDEYEPLQLGCSTVFDPERRLTEIEARNV